MIPIARNLRSGHNREKTLRRQTCFSPSEASQPHERLTFTRLTVPPGEEAVGQVRYRQAVILRGERRNLTLLDSDQPPGTLQVRLLGQLS